MTVDRVEVVWVTYLSLVANSRRKETREVVQEVVDVSKGAGTAGTTPSFLEQRRAKVALQALAERVDSLRASAACAQGANLRGGRSSDPDAAGAEASKSADDDTCSTRFDPDITVTNDDERGLTEVQIAGAERPGLMLDIMLSMRQGLFAHGGTFF